MSAGNSQPGIHIDPDAENRRDDLVALGVQFGQDAGDFSCRQWSRHSAT